MGRVTAGLRQPPLINLLYHRIILGFPQLGKFIGIIDSLARSFFAHRRGDRLSAPPTQPPGQAMTQ